MIITKRQSSASDSLRNIAGSLKDNLINFAYHLPPAQVPEQHPHIETLKEENTYSLLKWGTRYKIHSAARNLAFLHIGKCGGTTIRHHFLERGIQLRQYYLKRPWPYIHKPDHLFIWIRNPLHRFVSAFNHAKSIVDNDLLNSTFSPIAEPVSVERLNRKIRKGYAYTPRYDFLVSQFSCANELAESLNSRTPQLRRLATELMLHREEHIYKGIGWHTANGKLVENASSRIIFVGKLETLNDDIQSLATILEWPELRALKSSQKKRVNNSKLPKELSEQGVANILNFYKHTDYAALYSMLKSSHIDASTYEGYHSL